MLYILGKVNKYIVKITSDMCGCTDNEVVNIIINITMILVDFYGCAQLCRLFGIAMGEPI